MRTASAFENVRILDLCDEKGAYCGKLLAEMGAEVLLIEPPLGSSMRAIGPFHPQGDPELPHESSLFFWHYNANKRSVTIDLESNAGQQQLIDLVKTSDVLVESLPPGRLAALGLGHDILVAASPSLIQVSVSAFGQTGPYRDYHISDLVAQAMGGLIYVNGDADGPPLQGFGLPAYHSAGIAAATAVVLALMARTPGRSGKQIDVSIQASAAATLEHAISLYRENGTIARRTGGLHWTRAFRPGRCREGYAMHCTLGDWTTLSQWVAAALPDSDLASPRWDDADYRAENHEQLFSTLDAWAAGLAAEQLAEEAQMRRLAYAAVRPLDALLSHAQLRARGYFASVQHTVAATAMSHPGPPYVFSRTPATTKTRAPLLGEHNSDLPPSKTAEGAGVAISSYALAGQPLAGVRVLDFTWAAAGPLATRILAEQGADVIKIEPPGAVHDPSRRRLLAASLNRGKRSIVIDMNNECAIELVRALVARSDVVVDNFSPRVMPAWGLDHPSLCRIQPSIVSLGMSGFGDSGPFRDRVSYGPTLQADAGHVSMMPSPTGEPAGWGFSYSDMVAGRLAALAVLIALWDRQRTGQGQRIDLAQLESLIAVSGPALLAMQTSVGAPPPGNASQEAEAAPHGVYRCADRPEDAPAVDRWCAIAVFGDDDWRRFGRALDSPSWTRDRRFTGRNGRSQYREEIDARVRAWTASRSAEEVMTHLQAHGVAAGIVANARDLCSRDPQLRHRGFWVTTSVPGGGLVELDGSPFRDDSEKQPMAPSAPRAGQHTEDVLSAVLGLGPNEIAELRKERVVL